MNGQRKTYITASVALISVLSLGGWLWARHNKAKDEQLVEVIPAGKFGNDKPIKLRMTGGDLDQKQMQSFADERRKKMLDEYYALSEKDRVKKLDEMIDQQEEMRKEFGDLRAGGPTTIPSTQPGKDGAPQKMMISRKADPKMGTEGIPAAVRARMAELVSALNARRAERGLPPQNGVMMVFKSGGPNESKGGK